MMPENEDNAAAVERRKGVTHLTILNYVVVTILTAQSALLTWALHTIDKYSDAAAKREEASEKERKELLEHALGAKVSAEKAEKVAEATQLKVEVAQKTAEKIEEKVGAVQKTTSEVKKAVSEIQ